MSILIHLVTWPPKWDWWDRVTAWMLMLVFAYMLIFWKPPAPPPPPPQAAAPVVRCILEHTTLYTPAE